MVRKLLRLWALGVTARKGHTRQRGKDTNTYKYGLPILIGGSNSDMSLRCKIGIAETRSKRRSFKERD
jgi:hypothetical protein